MPASFPRAAEGFEEEQLDEEDEEYSVGRDASSAGGTTRKLQCQVTALLSLAMRALTSQAHPSDHPSTLRYTVLALSRSAGAVCAHCSHEPANEMALNFQLLSCLQALGCTADLASGGNYCIKRRLCKQHLKVGVL